MKEAEKVLEKAKFGLTAEEVAKKSGLNEKSAQSMLDKMVAERKAKRTRAGSNYFYRLAALIIFAFLLSGAAYAQDMNSTNFKAYPVMASAGGDAQGTTLKLAGKVGQPASGQVSSASFSMCAGFVCNFLEIITNAKVTFLLQFNISGPGSDAAFADNETALNQYQNWQINNYYACLHDTGLASSPAFGIIFAGSSLNYVNISSATNASGLRVSQDIPGNQFIIPITQTNCTVINTRLHEIDASGTVFNPFVVLNEAINAVELALGYPNIDIAGSFDRSGAFTLVIEKNDTDENQIIVKPA